MASLTKGKSVEEVETLIQNTIEEQKNSEKTGNYIEAQYCQ